VLSLLCSRYLKDCWRHCFGFFVIVLMMCARDVRRNFFWKLFCYGI
jgi:hypothetical protein